MPKGVYERKPRNLVHGTRTGYVYGCRCDECRAAQSAYARAYLGRPGVRARKLAYNRAYWHRPASRARRAEKVAAIRRGELKAPSHGASGYTNHGCRCDVCRAGNNEKMKAYFARHPEQVEKKNERMKRLYWDRKAA